MTSNAMRGLFVQKSGKYPYEIKIVPSGGLDSEDRSKALDEYDNNVRCIIPKVVDGIPVIELHCIPSIYSL